MKLESFNYYLPKNLISQKPCRPRDSSRLMILYKNNQKIIHDRFYNIDKYLTSKDILVANNSKVIPARLIGHKPTAGMVEILLLKQLTDTEWEIMTKGKVKINLEIKFDEKFKGTLIKRISPETWQIKFNLSREKLNKKIYKLGKTPTPPYIKRVSSLKEYQTIYAQHPGSAAAPTAGFHFTKKLINKLKKQGIELDFITLHVGLGTFQPVRVKDIKKHKMHSELAVISQHTADRLNDAKNKNKRIIAVGTTSARALEAFCKTKNKLTPGSMSVDIFIYPSYKFKFIDGLITNFHLPKSTLLMLVAAFAGKDLILHAYKQAIKKGYGFYSFGDAMLII